MSYIKHKIPVRITHEKLMSASLLYVGENGICTNEVAGRLLEAFQQESAGGTWEGAQE